MADKKYFSVTLPSGESRIVDADKIDQKRDWLDSHNAKVSEVNSFEITLPSGASKTVGPEEYESHIDWIKNHNATVKGSWVGAQQQSAPSARPGQQVRPPEAKRDPFKPSLELEGAMYESAPKPIRESSPVSVPERREVTPQQRADTRARIALGEPVIQRPNQPATSPVPKPGKVDFTAGHVYQVTTKNGDQIPVMIHPDADGVVDNGDGTVNVVINGAEVDGKPVISQMSKMQLQGMFDRTVNNSAREAEDQRARANTEQVRQLTDDIDAGIQEINDIASGRFRDAVEKESFAERLNRIMPMSSGGPGPMSMPATADKLNTLSQTEKDDYRALQAAQRSVRDASRIIEEANHNAQSGTFEKWLESSFAGGVARGFGQKFFDLDTWDMGVSDIQNGAALLAALDAFDKGEPLTKAQQMLLDAKAVELATNAYFGSYVGRGYKAGSVTAESIPFMIEMCINPASSIGNAATNKMARYAIQRFGKQAAKKGIHKVFRGAGRAAADLTGATIMAGTTGLPGVAGETMERMAGLNGDSVGYNEQGYSFFNGIRDGEAPVEAAAKAFGSRVIENYSEMVGEYFAPLLGGAGKAARRGMDKVHLGQVVDFIDNINGSDLAKMVGDFERHAKWNGPIGEYAEEVTGGIMNALLVGDQTLDADPETGVFNLDNNIDTFLGVGLMGGFFGAVKTFGYRTPKYRAKNQLDRSTSAGKAVFRNPDDWTAFTAMFSSDPNAAVRDVLTGDFTQQERQAALNYAKASMEYQGALTADQKREVSPEQKDAETSFDNGYSLSTPSEMHDAKVALDARRAALRDTFGEDDITLDELNVAEGAEGWTPEQKAVAMDYINAKATYDGMIQRVKDDIGNQTDQAYAEIDRNVNTDMNVVIPVTLADGRKGYIVRGNVSLGEDGRIDRSASDKAIIVRDAATGQNEWSTPALVVETDGLIDPLIQKEAVAAQIREEVAQAEADKIDGTLQYAEGETRQVVTQDGQLAEMTVVPNDKGMVENEDGTVNVAISAPDGSTVREELTRGQIAQAVEAADAARLAQFDAQRAERTQAEAATADEALARYASIPQGSDIKVHWETGDATYRFEGARLDEDGEVVFDAVDPENEAGGLIEIPAEAVINMDELLNAQPAPTVTENESVAGAPAQEPAVPVSGSGVKQYQEAPVEATYQDIYSDPSFETPEEASGFISGKIKRTEAALADAQKALDAVKPENYDTPADYKAARDAARQPVETARQTLDYWNAVRAYADSQAQPAPAAEPVLTEKAGPSSAEMQRKLNVRKAVEAKRRKGNYSAELDEIGKDGQIGSFKDFIRQTLLRGQAKLLWSDSKDGVQKGLGSHLNKGAGEMKQRIWLLRNEDGKYPEQLADELLEAYAGELGVDTDNVAGGDATFALNALLEVLREEPTASMMFEKVKEEHKSLKESSDGNDRDRQAAYDEMMREMDEEARKAGMLLYDLLDYYDLHLDERAREYSENYDEINAIFAEDQFDQYEQQLRESEEIHGRVPGEEGIRGSLEGGDALGEDSAEAPGRDSLRDLRGEDGGGEGNTGQARAGSVSDTPLAGAEEGAASEEVGDLPDFTGENPVVQAIDEAAAQVDTNPTDAQKEAGNYRKGHVTVDGYDISIENPKGSVRSGRDASGKEWSVTMNNNYGYIRRTEGVDGDHIDVFLSDDPTEGKVFVVDQVKPDGSFDEHKVMYGFGSADEASEAYLANYSPGWTGLGTITEVSKEEFRKWIDSSHRKTKPFSEYKSVKKDGSQHGGIDLDAEAAAAVAFTTGRSAEEVAAEREEARRVPLRDRVHEWERQVGVKANIIESLDGVKNAAARRAIERGETVSGWFEKGTGEVYVYLPGTADVSEVDKTYLHEVVAHKGVSEMLGPERFARLMDSVWNDVMSEKDRKEWTDYVRPDMNGRSEEDIRRAAADEYVANLAENLSTEDNRSAWDKFVAKVREILRDMGFDIKREDLQDILRESYERLRKEAAKKTAKAEKEPAAAPSKKLKDAKIEDFGQKIGGARKDQAREKIRDSFKLTAKDLLELKDPDKILSRKQIAKYLAEGQMTQGDAVMLLSANMAVRGATGMESFKTAMMMKYREMASAWEKGEDLSFDITDADVDYVFGQYPERIQQMPDIRSRIRRDFEHHLRDYNDYKRTYEALDYPNTARQIKSAYIREGRVDGKFWVVASPSSYRGWPFATFEEAVLKMKRVYPEVVNVEKEAKKAKDSGDVKTGHLKVVKDENGYYRVKSNLIPGQIFLSKRFYTRKQAEEYLNENAEALVEKETKMSYALMGSNIGMVQREGRDYRGGKDVNEKSFMETFAPRGVEFGNWVPQAERQEYLNKTYDAIMDFCEVVGISPKAFFLGGRLAVAFGARGKGGALAHYEPMKEVINLTRMKGAGSLAHEWFHALDNQLAKQKTGNTSDMATDTKNVVREEVAQAFREFVTAMNALDYSRRSRRAGAYWGEVWERAARLFADYTYNELGGKGIVSPLLARKPDEVDDQSEDFILSVWPYATKQENAAMKPYFDRLFAAIQEEEGTGVLFRKTGADHKKAQMDIISKTNPMKDDYHVGIRSVKDIHTLAEAVDAAREDARTGGWEELAAYPDVSNRTLENALRDGRITVFSSYPIANGVFVTPSRMQAKDYAGGGEVYSKTVPIDDVAWINTDEGMFAQVEKTLSDRVAEARFRKSNRTQNIFVSNAEAAVASIPMEKATPEQWEKMIAGKGGLKAGEDKWIGLTDWLHASRKKTLTKQEVADFIAAHRIEIEEKYYTDDYREAIDAYSADIADVLGKPVGGAYYGRYRNGEGKYELAINGPSADVDATYDMLMQKYGLADRREVDAILWGRVKDIEMPAKVNDVRKQYTTAGLQNNREIALTVPTIDPWAMTDETHFGDAGKGRAIAWIRFGDTVTSGAGDAEMSALNRELAKKYNVPPYRLNEVASDEDKARLDAAREKQNDDYRNGISGKKVLVIDEIQSNRHQAGRENGYQKPLTPEEAERLEDIRTRAFHRGLMRNQAHQAYEDARRDLDDKHYRNEISLEKYHEAINSPKIQELYENYVTLRREADDLRKEFQALHDELLPENAVPAAPFEKNWHELAFKRMLRYAAENGYDAVAWTTGDQQAKRYSLSRVSDSAVSETIPEVPGGYEGQHKSITIRMKESPAIAIIVDNNGVILGGMNGGEGFVGRSLSEVVGKENASRLMEKDGTIDFAGQEFGGEGMKGFYDEILPRFVNKYAKKWGAKVEDVQLNKVAESSRTMHSVRVTPEMKASVMEGQTMFRKANRTQNGFISNAEAAVESIPMEKATPEQWEKMIAGKGGLKAGEDKWLGLTDWLRSSRKKTITKDEVMDYIAENRIQIEEEQYGELELENLQAEFDEIYDGLIDGVENGDEEEQRLDYESIQTWNDFSRALMNPAERAWDELRERYHGGDDFDMAFSLDDRMRIQVDNEDAAGYFLGVRPINYTRKQYTTAGLQNNREIALWVPDIEPWHESDEVHFGDAGEGRAVAWVRFGETTTRTPATREEIEAYERSMPKADQWVSYKNYRGDTVYKTDRPDMGHDYIVERGGRFTVYLNEIPLNTEATLEEAVTSLNHTKSSYAPNDLKSRKVLVIDEIQSNRHQQGREKGYFNKKESEKADEEALRPVIQAENEFYDIVKELFGDKWRDVLDGEGVYPKYLETLSAVDVARVLDAQFKRSQARNAYEDQRADRVMNQETRLIPDAPFEKNWHELAFKRMLRYAAEEGYDVVAWTLGEQQAERYDIGKVIDSIDVTPLEKTEFGSNGKGVKVEINYKNNVRPDTPFEFDENGNGTLTDKNLEDYVGKDLAARILSMDRPGTISGDNLRIGAEGMKGFYDDIIPRFANKYGKKWGASTKDILVSLSNGLYLDAHSIEVTPSMKESVMRGQVMFSKEKRETGPFGTILRGYEGKAKEAIQKLMELREGEAIGALSHPEIGAIDLVWGNEGTGHSDGYGLAKLVKYHPEVVDKLQEILNDMHIVSKSENRINLESEKYRAAVRLTWDDQRKTWLLTVFEKKNSALDNTTDTGETSNGSERNDTATPQNTVSESKGSDNSGTSKSSGQKPLFSKLSRDVEDIVNDGKMRVSSENDEARAHLNERMMSIDKNLAKLRMAASAQREYDRETVRSITDLAKRLLDEGALSDPTRQEIEKMLTVTRWATGRKDLDGAVNAIMDLMVGNQLRHAKGVFDGLLKIRGSKVDARGVEVQGKLDAPGQRMMQVFKDAMDMAPEAIEEHIASAETRLDSPDDAVKAAAGDELVGLRMAREYVDDIRASIDEEKGIRNELRQAAEDRRAGRMSLPSYREFVASCDEALRQNRMDRINAYNSLTGRLSGKLYESIARGTAFRDEEKQRIERIHHFANSDLAGQKSDEHGNKNDRLTNNGIFRFLLKPLATFDQMLRHFGSKSVNGEGYLWNHFMRGWVDANDAEFQGMKAATDVLDRKVSDVFGRKMRWSDLYSVERKMPTVSVKFWDGGKMQDHELTQGNLLYIYMVNKMSDGRMKLRRMGIEEEHVNAIKEQMDPRFIELADWLQGEFLVNLRNKYNRVHEKLFGAPMAAIENYFPLKVLANARVREVDMATPDLDGTTPATITGSIIKRRKNALALDVIGTDAFSLVIEHLQQMEHWAAFAPFNQDLNTLLSYKTFRNRVQNMSGIYGAGSIIWENFRKSAEIAAGVYHPSVSRDSIDTAAVNIAKGVTAAKISFRVYTAIKQLLSLPAFISDANVGQLLKSMATPWKSWNWALKDLPGFQKRWLSKQAGDTRLMKTESDWKMWRNDMVKTASRLGMSPNAFVDALTVAVGAKAMYETRMKRYLNDGYTREQAEKRAKQDATILFNETQQSNENAFLSAMQLDRTWASVALTVFRNSSMGYQRQLVDAVRNLGRKLRPDYKDEAVEFMSKQMVRDGVDEQDARDAAERNYRKSTFRDALRVALFGFVVQFAWNLGKYLPYLIAGDDDDEKKKMLKDAALHGLLGGTVEGLSGGSVISEAANLLASGEGLKNYDPSLMPVASDIQRIIKMASYDQVAAANEVVNLLVQAGVGVNPQTLTDIGVAIYDACNGDLETSKEATLLLMRVLQCPQSQVDKVYIDELDLTAEKGLDLSIADFARRYAEYKVRRNATTLGWAYSDEAREKRINTYEKRFTKQAQELIRTRGSDLDRAYYEYVDTEHKEVDATLRDLRSGIRTSAQSGDQMGAMEYAQMLNDFMQTPEFQRYSKAHGNINAIKRLQTALKSADGNSRDAIEDQILQLKKQMVDELKRTDNK